MALALTACAEEPPPNTPTAGDQLKARAREDLGCDIEQIKTRTLDDRTRIAWGCGKKATYIESCETCGEVAQTTNLGFGLHRTETETKRCNCTWMLNSTVRAE